MRPVDSGLHDLAIQRLFAGGMSLQSLLTQFADRPQTVERIQRVVDDLDESIKIIRSTVYALGRRGATGDTDLRPRRVAKAGLASTLLGFSPALRMTGLLDTLVAGPCDRQPLAAVTLSGEQFSRSPPRDGSRA